MASQPICQSSLSLVTWKEAFKDISNQLCQNSVTTSWNMLCKLHTKHCCWIKSIWKPDLTRVTNILRYYLSLLKIHYNLRYRCCLQSCQISPVLLLLSKRSSWLPCPWKLSMVICLPLSNRVWAEVMGGHIWEEASSDKMATSFPCHSHWPCFRRRMSISLRLYVKTRCRRAQTPRIQPQWTLWVMSQIKEREINMIVVSQEQLLLHKPVHSE